MVYQFAREPGLLDADSKISPRIIVDADACPKNALSTCVRLGSLYRIPVWTVSSMNHEIESDHHITVGPEPQATDMKVANLAQAGDVCVTQDFGLAALLLGKGAKCLGPTGKEYRPETIEFLLEEREMKARFRRGGGRTRGPKRRSRTDDDRFERSLRRILDESEEARHLAEELRD